jgi:hypothetical protein
MRQQINLYQDVLLDKPEPFQSRQVGVLLIIFVFCLGLVGFYSYWQVNSSLDQVDGLRQQQRVIKERVAQLEKKFPAREPNVLLREKNKRLEQTIMGQRQALDYFSKQDRGSNKAILASLEGLAMYPQEGIWLRQVRLLQAGQEIQLAGSALKAEQIPEYLHLLGEKNIFGGQVFSQLKLTRLKEQADQVDFELNSSKGGSQ